MTLNMNESEMNALEELAFKKGMSKTHVMRQAFRMYQTIEIKAAKGDKFYFKSEEREKIEILFL